MTVKITFKQDLVTWEDTYRKGSTHECPEHIAKAWEAEGLVTIGDAPAVVSEAAPTISQPNTTSKKTRRKA